MPLPKAWRFVLHNKTGVQLDFSGNSANEKASVEFIQANWASDGSVNWDAGSTTHSAGSDLANGSTLALTNVTGEDDVVQDGIFHAETDNTSASGDLILGIESSPDGGTAWPSDATDFDPDTELTPVGVINFGGAEVHDILIRV